jgi:hypothetical protein
MLKSKRFRYFILCIGIILLGILSRSSNLIPLFFGDVLYAMMIYFGLYFLFVPLTSKQIGLLALGCCFCIEGFQLCQADWIVAIRRTTIGHYALGQGFLWSDLFYYTFGVLVAYFIDVLLVNNIRLNT